MINFCKMKSIPPLILIFVLALIFAMHLEDKSNANLKQMSDSRKQTYYQYGETVIVKSFTVGNSGDIFKINNTGTLLDGMIINIPAGTILEEIPIDKGKKEYVKEINISVGYNNGTLVLNNLEDKVGDFTIVIISKLILNGKVTDLEFDYFQFPISITVPFKHNTNSVPVVYSIDDNGELHLSQLTKINETVKTFTFDTFHPGKYSWIYALKQ